MAEVVIPALVLKPRYRIFADEFLSGEHTGKQYNATYAAAYAGYDYNPSHYGSKLLRHPAVKEYIAKRLDALSMSAGEVLMRLTEIARHEVGDVVKLDPTGRFIEIDPNAVVLNKRFIKSITYDSNGNPKIEFHDAHAALRDIARIRSMFTDGVAISGPGGGGIPLAMTIQFVNPDGTTAAPNQNLLPPAQTE